MKLPRATLTIGDQVLSSASNIAFALIVSQFTSPEAFGRFAIMYGIYVLALGIARAFASEPLLLSSVDAAGATELRNGILGAVLLVALMLGGATGAYAALNTSLEWGLLALGIVPLLLQDGLRFIALKQGEYSRLLLLDAIWMGVQYIIISIILVSSNRIVVFEAIASWLAGASVAASYGCYVTSARPELRAGKAWLHRNRKAGAAMAVDFLSGQGAIQASLMAVALVAGTASAGAIRLAQVAFGPINVLVNGLRGWVTPELVRLSPDRSYRLVLTLAGSLGSASALTTVSLAFIPRDLGIALLGETWSLVVGAALVFIGIETTVSATGAPMVWALRVQGQYSSLALARVLVGASMVGAAALGASWGGTSGAAAGMAASSLVMTTYLLVRVRQMGGSAFA